MRSGAKNLVDLCRQQGRRITGQRRAACWWDRGLVGSVHRGVARSQRHGYALAVAMIRTV